MTDSIFVRAGQRAMYLGKTGSGKSQGAMFQIRNTDVRPNIKLIFDSKIDNVFFSLPERDESMELIEGLENFDKFAKTHIRDLPDYALIRPTESEFMSPEIMDGYLQRAYLSFGAALIYIDEVTNFHGRAGNAYPGLINLLTRGRSKKKTTIMSSQRPRRISMFAMTETDHFHIFKLQHVADRKYVSEVVPNFADLDIPPPFHFYFYDSADSEYPELFKPVPELKENPAKVFKRKWL